ncbi:hypothetical protein BCR35DRAFT_307372 [Leucosporidium creatinivorum]|uniref:SET domain-containing protein n=1 Tax=Leucosporidium creatinivorum TaxID=106004 RepID=A0A1Y2EQJ2_9BASI|nr:hypothetical protein BCR35DRAFT_307372 [Leucosporidium creatinivorum]
MSDWKALKERRTQKGPLLASTTSTREEPVASPQEKNNAEGGAAEAASSPASPVASTSKLVQHDDLPSTLEVREVVGRGRGIFTKTDISTGTTALSTAPLVSVLDNNNIFSRCSACFIAEDDLTPGKLLSQCSLCHSLRYCSAACQKRDWVAHKHECKALITFRNAAKGEGIVPDTPIRALGRLLWAMEKGGCSYRAQVESLQSHREELTSEQKEQFFQLSVSVASYVGQQTLAASCSSAAAIIDLCSRFTSNSFSLTSPHLSNIGVSISPLVALINHACLPNAVVVFPSYHTSSNPQPMRVVAIRDIKPGEELLTSYVDLGLPLRRRKAQLRESYHFECTCALCFKRRAEWVDPREALKCRKEQCVGLLRMPDVELQNGDVETACETCGGATSTNVEHLKATIATAESELAAAESLQYTDSAAATSSLFDSVAVLQAASFAPTSHPYLPTLQTLLATLLHSQSFVQALPTAQLVYTSLCTLHPQGHPARAIALAAVGKLRIVGTNSGDEERYWRDEAGLQETVGVLVEGLKEVVAAFGRGGVLEGELRDLIRQTEEGLKMTRMARGL